MLYLPLRVGVVIRDLLSVKERVYSLLKNIKSSF